MVVKLVVKQRLEELLRPVHHDEAPRHHDITLRPSTKNILPLSLRDPDTSIPKVREVDPCRPLANLPSSQSITIMRIKTIDPRIVHLLIWTIVCLVCLRLEKQCTNDPQPSSHLHLSQRTNLWDMRDDRPTIMSVKMTWVSKTKLDMLKHHNLTSTTKRCRTLGYIRDTLLLLPLRVALLWGTRLVNLI